MMCGKVNHAVGYFTTIDFTVGYDTTIYDFITMSVLKEIL